MSGEIDPQIDENSAAVPDGKVLTDLVDLPHSRGSVLTDFTKNGPLLPAEEKLRIACMRGETCVIGDGERPSTGTDENKIRASFLRYLILGGCKDSPIHQRGINLIGAFIACRISPEYGKCLDLEAVTISQDVALANCRIDGAVILYRTKSKALNLHGSAVIAFHADGLDCDGSLYLRHGFEASSEVRLPGAKIGGDLSCVDGKFVGDGRSLVCDRIETKGGIFLADGFEASGEVRLLGAKISGNLECDGGDFLSEGRSLSCDGIETKGSVFLRDGFEASGAVRLLGAKIGGDLTCNSGWFKSDLIAPNALIGGNLWLDEGFQIHGAVYLPNAHISGNINCDGGFFHSKDKAVHANKAVIEGNVVLGKMNSAGTFSFQSATIGGDFSANGATLSAQPAIELRGAEIKGAFHWRDIKHVPGRLDLGGTSAKTVNMDEKSWRKPASIKLNNFTYKSFDNLEPGANSNYWKRFLRQQPEDDLGKKFRPRPYEQLAEVLHSMGYEEEARSIRIERQRRHTNFMAHHDPDRYATGADGRRHIRPLHWLNVFARKAMIGPLVDYGFRPGKAILYLLALIVIGSGIYWKAASAGIMTPTHPLIFKEAEGGFIPKACAENWVHFPEEIAATCADAMPSEYSEFNSVIYAADVALPIVNLRMENDWAPRVVDTSGNPDQLGWWVRTFEWFLIIAGWVLSLLFASAVGGIIRR